MDPNWQIYKSCDGGEQRWSNVFSLQELFEDNVKICVNLFLMKLSVDVSELMH